MSIDSGPIALTGPSTTIRRATEGCLAGSTRGYSPAIADQQAPELQKSLKSRHMTMISLGGVIGAGLFVGSSAVIHTTGPASVLSYLMAGVLVVLIMRMLGEMAVANPQVGSFAEYARRSLGGWAGFTTGWLYWYLTYFAIAAMVVVISSMALVDDVRSQLIPSFISLAVVLAAYWFKTRGERRTAATAVAARA
jgi:L-asparagine transporter-like permease